MERLDAFMARANAAYYATRDPFADFVTSPEISQVFGELLGLWAGVVWQSMGAPKRIVLAEAGPGRGTLMADALRAIGKMMPDFAAALDLHLIETSPRLRAAQADKLAAVRVAWHESPNSLPDGPLLFLANEFFDALPIRQFARRDGGWRERFVENGAFVEIDAAAEAALYPWSACPARADRSQRPLFQTDERSEGANFEEDSTGTDAQDRDKPEIRELNEASDSIVQCLAARIAAHGGAALLIDYGPEVSAPGDSLQALRGGKPADPLADPGEADLTAHVDFQRLAELARHMGAATHGPVPQGIFLARLGLFQRTGQLARTQPPRQAGELMQSAQRLAEPDRMGRLFKALAICHPGLPIPPGFAE